MYPEDSQVGDTEAVDGVGDTVSSLSEKESPQFKKKHSNGHIHSKHHHWLVTITLTNLSMQLYQTVMLEILTALKRHLNYLVQLERKLLV